MTSRRRLLRSLGAAGAPCLPYLPWLEREATAAEVRPRRLVLFITGNGTFGDEWKPSGDAASLALGGRILQPLERHKARIVAVKGLVQSVFALGPGTPHARAVSQALTAQPALGDNATDGGGVSIDQLVAGAIAGSTPLRTLQLGAGQARPYSFIGARAPVAPQSSPQVALDRVFAGVPKAGAAPAGAAAGPSLRLQQRQRIFAALRPQLDAVTRKLGRADRLRVEAHVEALRDLERELVELDRRLAVAGGRPEVNVPARNDWQSFAAYGAAVSPQCRIGAAALAADLTRVLVLNLGNSGNVGLNLGFVGHDVEAHITAHEAASRLKTTADKREAVIALERWHAERFAELLDVLAGYADGDGRLLDNCLVVWMSGLARGDHDINDLPVLLAGGAGGKLRGGRLVTATGHGHGELFVSIAQAFGLPVTSFGHASQGRAPLAGVFV